MTFWQKQGATRIVAILVFACVTIGCGLVAAWFLPYGEVTYSSEFVSDPTPTQITKKEVVHFSTPDPLKAVYMTACTASVSRLRNKVLANFDDTELNAIVIDVKDYTGTDSYASTTLQTGAAIGRGCRIADLPKFIEELHDRGIYTIARITVFQDPLYVSQHPDLAVRSKSRPDSVWKDKNGLAYLDPGAKPYWDYIVNIGKESYGIGFDELNFDYIRYPSDGDLRDMNFLWSEGKTKPVVLKEFFRYLREQFDPTMLASTSPELRVLGSIPLSADLFGLTTTAADDMGIGQLLLDALQYFDYVAPMVYPSHFAPSYMGYARPADHPYEVVKYSMSHAVSRALAASSSPEKLRPWLQAFDLGATYTPAMVRAQIQATYDAGLSSWMLWNAASIYNKDALDSLPYSK